MPIARRSRHGRLRRTCLGRAGSALLARIAVAQQQNARATAAGAGMAHHRNDGADLAGHLRPDRARRRVREPALRPEQGDRPGSAALVRGRRADRCLEITLRSSGRSARAQRAQATSRPPPIRMPPSRWPGSTSSTTSTVALLMAVAIALLASLAIAHTLAPAQQIVAALQRMARGQYRTSLPRFRSMDLAMIGQAVGDLGDRLAQAMEERAAMTRRLLEIRSDERRVLARELHDEFGQNLTAILAFANTIEATSAQAQGTERGRAGRADDLASHSSHHRLPARYLEPPAPSARRGTRARGLPGRPRRQLAVAAMRPSR